MGSLNKGSASILILFILILSLTLLKIEPTNAQTIPTPTVPKFSVSYANSSIEVTILNQPFNPHQIAGPTTLNLYYTVREKEHSSDNWNDYPQYQGNYYPNGNYPATNTDYTVMNFGFYGSLNGPLTLNPVLSGEQLDFQVKAAIGFYVTEPYFPPNQSYPPSSEGTVQVFSGYFSDWSNTQTITIPESNTSSTSTITPTPKATPSQTSPSPISPMPTINTGPHTEPFPISTALVVAFILIAAVIASILILNSHRKTAKQSK
jgi:hypothetical protein